MLHLSEMLHTVAGALYPVTEWEEEKSLSALSDRTNDFNIGITDDVGESEQYFRDRYDQAMRNYPLFIGDYLTVFGCNGNDRKLRGDFFSRNEP